MEYPFCQDIEFGSNLLTHQLCPQDMQYYPLHKFQSDQEKYKKVIFKNYITLHGRKKNRY